MKKLVLAVILTLSAGVVFGQTKRLNILYSNDLHGHLEPHIVPWVSKTRTVGGFANIATIVKREKKLNKHTVYFDAGDYFTGPYISSLTKGEAIIDVMNTLGVDAATVGNHEFDHGWENAVTQLARARFPILNGNIYRKDNGLLLWRNPTRILNIDGLRVGIIGLHGKFAFYDTTSAEMITGVEARDEEPLLRRYIAELQPKTDIIVLLVHQGVPGRQSSTGAVDVARNLQRDIELAQNVPGIDVMVTGHAHQGTPEPLVSNGTIIVSTDAYGIELGKLELVYDRKLDKVVSYKNNFGYLFDDEVPDDPATLAAVRKWKDKLRSITEEVVSTTPVELRRSYGEESLLGNMVADAMRHAFPSADFAITNSGGLRADVDAGPITVGDLISAFPFPNTIVQLEMTGRDIRALFEHGAGLTNGILQVSREVKMSYDESKPVGQRVVSVLINGKPLDDARTYKLLTSNFLADGGDGFAAFSKRSVYKNSGVEILQAMVSYMKTFKRYEPVIEGRVVRGNSNS